MGHSIDLRVYYADTDAGGIVYHANYLNFAERGRTELLRAAGFDHQALLADPGILFVVRRLEAEYLKTARLDDVLTVKTAIKSMNNASFLMKQTIFCHDSVVFSMDVTLVCVTTAGKPTRLPDLMRERFQPFVEMENE